MKSKQNFVKAKDFCDRNEVSVLSLCLLKHNKSVPNFIFKIKTKREGLDVDENYFIKRKEFAKKCWLNAHENYFKLLEDRTERKMSKQLHIIDSSISVDSWCTFLNRNLFSLQPESILLCNTTKKLYLFLKYTNWIIRRGF